MREERQALFLELFSKQKHSPKDSSNIINSFSLSLSLFVPSHIVRVDPERERVLRLEPAEAALVGHFHLGLARRDLKVARKHREPRREGRRASPGPQVQPDPGLVPRGPAGREVHLHHQRPGARAVADAEGRPLRDARGRRVLGPAVQNVLGRGRRGADGVAAAAPDGLGVGLGAACVVVVGGRRRRRRRRRRRDGEIFFFKKFERKKRKKRPHVASSSFLSIALRRNQSISTFFRKQF